MLELVRLLIHQKSLEHMVPHAHINACCYLSTQVEILELLLLKLSGLMIIAPSKTKMLLLLFHLVVVSMSMPTKAMGALFVYLKLPTWLLVIPFLFLEYCCCLDMISFKQGHLLSVNKTQEWTPIKISAFSFTLSLLFIFLYMMPFYFCNKLINFLKINWSCK